MKPSGMIAVWFSCGAASAIAVRETIRRYGDSCEVRVVNNPVAEEHPDNQRFLRDVAKWLDVEIEIANNPKYPDCSAVTVWEHKKYMEGIHGAPCTAQLKKEARRVWENINHPDWHVLGFTADEEARHHRFVLSERENLLPVLIEAGLTKDDCMWALKKAGIDLPEMYKLGYVNANCIGCVKATSPTYWNHVRKTHPDIFTHRAEQSREIGCRLVRVKGERIFLHELDPEALGQPMQTLQAVDCGIFCEEPIREQQELF